MRSGLIALGAFLILGPSANAADLTLRPRPMKPVESRPAPAAPQLFQEIFPWLRQQR